MRIRRSELAVFLALFVLLAVPTIVSSSPQSFADAGLMNSAPVNFETTKNITGHDIIERMLQRNRMREQLLQSYSALRTYEVRAPDGRVVARDVIRVDYRTPGIFEFHKISEHGSWMIRRLVFDRLLQSEQETAAGLVRQQAAISEENYDFSIVGEVTLGADRCYVLKAQPKRADKYLFEGELWISARDYAIAKMSGRPAKELSFWIDDANFVREYQRLNGFWLPRRDETFVDGRFNSKRVLSVDHQQYVINAPSPTSAADAKSIPAGKN